eukprot:COSAG04_NODE_28524_length_275_cov_0.585227_1_plen_36_part_10
MPRDQGRSVMGGLLLMLVVDSFWMVVGSFWMGTEMG